MELKDLENSIRTHRRAAVAFVFLVATIYTSRFLLDQKSCLSPAAETWGQFGDFIGGILNPVIAFLAFYWLTQSVLIQKTELNDTKKALVESARSQSHQVLLAERAARISALGSILDSKNAEVAHMRHAFEIMVEGRIKGGWANTPDGDWIGGAKLNDYIAEYQTNLEETQRQQGELIEAIQATIQSAA